MILKGEGGDILYDVETLQIYNLLILYESAVYKYI